MTEVTKTGQVMVLGPVAIRVGTDTIVPPSPVHRALLGALAAADGRAIRTESLAGLLGHAEPAGAAARTAVQVAVHRLRRWLEDVSGGLSVETTVLGYALRAEPLDTDVRRFRAFVARATGLSGVERTALLHQALSLWRGDPLADVSDDRRDPETVAQLERERVSAAKLYATAAIAQGSAEAAAEMLAPLAHWNPLDEQTHALLIRALAAAGRPAEALAAYQSIRGALRAELDTVPGPELEAAQQAALRPAEADDAETGPAAKAARPDQLPASVEHFAGRTQLLARLGERVRSWAAVEAASVVALSGRPGVGKTALAVHAAHEFGNAFPGGRLYVDLRGAEARPLDPHDVLDRFLRALGVHEPTIPESREDRAALYRSRLADSRTLVVLDNAASEEQIQPLLPGVGCLVLITSRIRLTGLAGATHLDVDSLPEGDALSLLTAALGEDRLAGASKEAADLVRWCGFLPLALRIAAARLAANPHWTVKYLAGLLADERRRLEQLSFDHLDVRASFNLTYVGLTEPAQQLFRALSELELVDFPAWVGPALRSLPAGHTSGLDELVEARLVDVSGMDALGQPRLLLHDLVRLFGRERSRQEDTDATRRTALRHVFDGFLYLAQQAEATLGQPRGWTTTPRPRPAAISSAQAERLLAEPLRLLAIERDRLVRATIQACALDLSPTNWELAACLAHYWEGTCSWEVWRQTHEAALAATRRTGDVQGEAVMLTGLGAYYYDQNQHSTGIELLLQAGPAFRTAGDLVGEAETQRLLGSTLRRAGRLDEAETASIRALSLYEGLPDTGLEQSFAWWNLGWVDMQRRRFDAARERMGRALELDTGGYPRHLGIVLHGFAMLEYWAGGYQAGVEWAERELALWRENQEPRGAAYGLLCLGQNLVGLGRYDAARLALLDGFALMEELSLVDGLGQALTGLATLHRLTGDPETSLQMMDRAIEFCERIESPTHTSEAWIELAEVHDALGAPAEARRARERAITYLEQIGSPLVDEVRARL